jgi:hypothetical protein
MKSTLTKTGVLGGLLLAAFTGCDEGLPTVPVTGTVTFAGSPPPAAGTITFAPIEVPEGLPRRPGSGKFSPAENSYEVTSFAPGDGLIPGRYQINITCYTQPPTSARPETFVTYNAVPENWHPTELVVPEYAEELELDYDVPLKK